MRRRNRVVLASSIVILLVTAMACSDVDPSADRSAVTSSEPVDATTTAASAPDPPPAVPYVAPTAIRELVVDWADLGMLYPLNETELLSIVRYGPNPDGTANPRFSIFDIVTGTSTPIPGPSLFVQRYGAGPSLAVTSQGLYFASATCEDRPGECIAPRVEVWWWDASTREWSEVGNYDPSELVGEHWDGSNMRLGFGRFEEGDDLPLAVSDDTDDAKNRGSHVIVIDPATGEFEREPAERFRGYPPPECETPSGLTARLASAQTLEPGRSSGEVTGTLEIQAQDGEWTDVAGMGPASHLTCALDSIWVLADGQWLNIDEQGATLSVQILESPTDVSVALDVFTAVGAGTDDIALVRQLGTDQRADLELHADRLDIIVYTGADRPPVAHKVPRGIGTGDLREASVGTYADALPVVGLQPYPPFAIGMPGGRVVILAANGNRLQTLLIAE